MRKLFGVLLLVTCFSMPTFAGHNQVGGDACTCGTPGCIEDYPGECSGSMHTAIAQPAEGGSDATGELGIALVAFLIWMRIKA